MYTTDLYEGLRIETVTMNCANSDQIDHDQANVSFDHPLHAPLEHALNIDFVNTSQGLDSRIAVELSAPAARELVQAILSVLDQAEAGGHLPKE